MSGRVMRALVLATAVASSLACDRFFPERADITLPPVDSVQAQLAGSGISGEIRYSGNVLEIMVEQPADQLRRGGPLWARVGPYIYLFTPGTRALIDRYDGIAGVRVITRVGDTEVARAMLVRDALNDYSWPRAINTMATAIESGTARPSMIERLVNFGEQHTQFEYNPDYVPPR